MTHTRDDSTDSYTVNYGASESNKNDTEDLDDVVPSGERKDSDLYKLQRSRKTATDEDDAVAHDDIVSSNRQKDPAATVGGDGDQLDTGTKNDHVIRYDTVDDAKSDAGRSEDAGNGEKARQTKSSGNDNDDAGRGEDPRNGEKAGNEFTGNENCNSEVTAGNFEKAASGSDSNKESNETDDGENSGEDTNTERAGDTSGNNGEVDAKKSPTTQRRIKVVPMYESSLLHEKSASDRRKTDNDNDITGVGVDVKCVQDLQAMLEQRTLALKSAVEATLTDAQNIHMASLKNYVNMVEKKSLSTVHVVKKVIGEKHKEITLLQKEVSRFESREIALQRKLELASAENATLEDVVSVLREELKDAHERTAQAHTETHAVALKFQAHREEATMTRLAYEAKVKQQEEDLQSMKDTIDIKIRNVKLSFQEERTTILAKLEKSEKAHQIAIAERELEVAHLASILDQQTSDTCAVASTELTLRQELAEVQKQLDLMNSKNIVLQKGTDIWKVKARECEVITAQYASQISELERRSEEVMKLASDRGIKNKVLQQKVQQLEVALEAKRTHSSVQSNKARSALELENERLALRIMSLERQVPYSSMTNITTARK